MNNTELFREFALRHTHDCRLGFDCDLESLHVVQAINDVRNVANKLSTKILELNSQIENVNFEIDKLGLEIKGISHQPIDISQEILFLNIYCDFLENTNLKLENKHTQLKQWFFPQSN